MSVRRVTPDEAAGMMSQGWILLDVRSCEEFESGHPEGAFNIPFLNKATIGMTPNEDFEPVVDKCFGKDDRLIIGCRTGNRSLRAAERLCELGFTNVVDMRGGFAGEKDADGQLVCEGWEARSLPVGHEAAAERTYEQLKANGTS